MNNKEQTVFSVEYEMSGVVFYKTVLAYSFEDAKKQISQRNPHMLIRAVSLITDPQYNEQEEQKESRL